MDVEMLRTHLSSQLKLSPEVGKTARKDALKALDDTVEDGVEDYREAVEWALRQGSVGREDRIAIVETLEYHHPSLSEGPVS